MSKVWVFKNSPPFFIWIFQRNTIQILDVSCYLQPHKLCFGIRKMVPSIKLYLYEAFWKQDSSHAILPPSRPSIARNSKTVFRRDKSHQSEKGSSSSVGNTTNQIWLCGILRAGISSVQGGRMETVRSTGRTQQSYCFFHSSYNRSPSSRSQIQCLIEGHISIVDNPKQNTNKGKRNHPKSWTKWMAQKVTEGVDGYI